MTVFLCICSLKHSKCIISLPWLYCVKLDLFEWFFLDIDVSKLFVYLRALFYFYLVWWPYFCYYFWCILFTLQLFVSLLSYYAIILHVFNCFNSVPKFILWIVCGIYVIFWKYRFEFSWLFQKAFGIFFYVETSKWEL